MALRIQRWIAPCAAALAVVLVGRTCVWTIDQNQQGVVLRFGRAARVVPAGIHFTLPSPIETMLPVNTTEVRRMPVGFKLRDEVRGIPPTAEESQWLTGDTNIVEIQANIQYRIKEPVEYLFRVSDLDAFESKDFVLRRIAESALTAEVARMSVDDVLVAGKSRLQEAVRETMQRTADEMRMGIQIVSASILAVNPPMDVMASFNEVASAKQDNDRLITEAEGHAQNVLPSARREAARIVNEAEIYRNETVQKAHGVAQRFGEIARQVRAAPAVSRQRLWLETVQAALARAQIIQYTPVPGTRFRLIEVK